MDLQQHLLRQMAFSHATYGPGKRTEGVTDHIRKELVEVAEAQGVEQIEEWVDVVILALDGLTRRLAFSMSEEDCTDPQLRMDPEVVVQKACEMILQKQTRNEARNWPDWRTAEKGKAIEHVA